jgi:high-affinity iron transporter
MLGSALIVFRETLEAALIVAIVLGATRGVAGRGRWVGMGILGGVAGALVVAAFAGAIAESVEGRGQALLNAGILIAAVCMLAWHNTWMSAHGREISARMKQVGRDVSVGAKPLSALALVTLFAVLREGSETVLFLYGLASSGAGAASLLGGGALGLLAGIGLGTVLYRGLLIIPTGQFLNVVGWLVLLLAAGLAANAAMFLNQAGLVPALVPQVWNTSWLLAQQSWLGTLLHILVGYSDRPSGIELLFYLVTLAAILGLMRTVGRPSARRIGSPKAAP